MSRFKNTSVLVCDDCLMGIAYDDYSALDLNDDADERMDEIKEGMASLTADIGDLCVGDSENDCDFSAEPCACCGTRLAGARKEVIGLQRHEIHEIEGEL